MLNEWLEYRFLGHSLNEYAFALATAVVVFLVLQLLKRGLSRLKIGNGSQAARVFTLLRHRTSSAFIGALSFMAGALSLELGPRAEKYIGHVIALVVIIQGVAWIRALIAVFLDDRTHAEKNTDPAKATSLRVLAVALDAVVFVLATLLILDNFGVNITTLVAGLGIGGIAVALALQSVLGDIFASLTIVLDQPFVIGDAIAVDGLTGSVEHIGLKTTRLRAIGGEQLIFSNSDLLKSRIRNLKRMQLRRVVLQIGVVYETSREMLQTIPVLLKAHIEKIEHVQFERAHLVGFGPSSLDFETVYWITSSDYSLYLDAQQSIALEILEAFRGRGIEFAYPTQTIIVSKEAEPRNK